MDEFNQTHSSPVAVNPFVPSVPDDVVDEVSEFVGTQVSEIVEPSQLKGSIIKSYKVVSDKKKQLKLKRVELKARLMTYPEYMMADTEAKEKAKERRMQKMEIVAGNKELQDLEEEIKYMAEDLKLIETTLSGMVFEYSAKTKQLSLFDDDGQAINFELVAKVKGDN